MPPHLHPRSTATSTLFAGTLLASFIVVGIPHIFPCPRPRRQYADSEQRPQTGENGPPMQPNAPAEVKQGTRVSNPSLSSPPSRTLQEEAALFRQLQEEAALLEKQARECPVPKPNTWIPHLFAKGTGKDNKPGSDEKG